MIWNRSGRRLATTVLVMVISISMLTLAAGTTASALTRGTMALAVSPASHHTIVVYPNGHDDTSDLQAAFNACVSYVWGCTVQLVKGTYYTEQIAVTGFQGSFVGAGQGRTVIQALSSLPTPGSAYNTPTVPFWAGMPTGATGTNPWPDLFTFVGGTFSISGMTINEPYANPITSPGWSFLGGVYVTYLWAVILVTGDEAANAAITQVTVNGAGGGFTEPYGTPSTFNLDTSITYEGMLLPTVWTNPYADQIPVSGTFSLTDSVIYWSGSAFWSENLLDATVHVISNSVSSTPLPGFADVSNSQLYFVGNSITNVMDGAAILGLQSDLKTGLLPSTVYVVDNYMEVNWYGSGLGFGDFGGLDGIAATLSAVVTGNVIVVDMSCGCYTYLGAEATGSFSLVSALFLGNLIEGGSSGILADNVVAAPNTGPVEILGNTVIGAVVGIAVLNANGSYVAGNLVKNSGVYGIQVGFGASYNTVAYNLVKGSGTDDLYWDTTGTGNVWTHNICSTSSPPGLC